ncbi:MAG: hypothetical protein N2506_07495, partial [Dehalococcoidales bacterium]|nr:hypothetical protein [Dehalococcoidales bacterium]
DVYKRQLTDAIGNEKCPVHTARRGGTIETGKLKFTILHPQTLAESPNNNSVVLHLRYGEIDFLFMGDAEKEDEETMAGILPDTEVLKLGHHASRSSSSADFLRLTSPEVAVYTAGVGNRYGHPHAETLDALRNIGAMVYGTDTHGTIVITTDGKTYEVKTGK